ncbi:hypothetical protein KY284_012671 [Solanum tuberosum]|nr:hypothetical protein KY284_012671 [Solanum tuberosum]
MNNTPGEHSSHLTREFYSSYAATLMNFATETVITKWGQKEITSTWGPLNSIMVWGKSIDISEITINMMLHGPKYTAPTLVGLFEGKHHVATSENEMEVQSSRELVLRWIARQIALEGENVAWVTGTPTLITKASLSLSPSLDSLVACLMAGYPVNVGQIIVIEMRDRELNERDELSFPCLIGKLCRQAIISPNKLFDRWGKAFRLTQASKIKDVTNHLFGAKSGAVGSLAVVPHVPIDIPHAEWASARGVITTIY